jgi:hypothetical protein
MPFGMPNGTCVAYVVCNGLALKTEARAKHLRQKRIKTDAALGQYSARSSLREDNENA